MGGDADLEPTTVSKDAASKLSPHPSTGLRAGDHNRRFFTQRYCKAGPSPKFVGVAPAVKSSISFPTREVAWAMLYWQCSPLRVCPAINNEGQVQQLTSNCTLLDEHEPAPPVTFQCQMTLLVL